MSELEHFAMKSDYGRLTGVAVACHAIRDAYLLMHVGVGCKNKVTHLLTHDWEVACNLRQGWTEVGDRDLIVGASGRIGPYVRSWQKRMDSGFVCVVNVTFLELAGEDAADHVEQIDAGLQVPVVMVDALGFDGDEFLGYALVQREVITRVPWSDRPNPKKVALLGYWFDRYEGDHSGNLSQIAGMLKAIGLQPGPVLFSGRNYADYADAADAGVLVELPYLAPVRKKLRRFWKKKGRQPLVTELPIGIEGTSRWLRQVGEAAGVDGRLVEAYLQRRTERTLAPLRKMHSRWRNQRVAVFAEAPLAQGVTGLLRELGFEVVLVGIRGSTLGGVEIEGADVLEQPSLARIRDELLTRLRQGELQGVIGSATELAVLRGLDASEVPEGCSPFLLELGFPCLHYHALQQLPVMGFGGVATMAQRLLTAPRLWDDGRAGGVWG